MGILRFPGEVTKSVYAVKECPATQSSWLLLGLWHKGDFDLFPFALNEEFFFQHQRDDTVTVTPTGLSASVV